MNDVAPAPVEGALRGGGRRARRAGGHRGAVASGPLRRRAGGPARRARAGARRARRLRSPPIWPQAAQRAATWSPTTQAARPGSRSPSSPSRRKTTRRSRRPSATPPRWPPHLRPGRLLVVSSPTAEHAGGVAAATVELLTGLRAGADYALAHLFGPVRNGRLIVSGVDVASATRARGVARRARPRRDAGAAGRRRRGRRVACWPAPSGRPTSGAPPDG